jgi:DNA processing protein
MKEPPLFLEYQGVPVWKQAPMISVVGSREISPLTQKWMKGPLADFVARTGVTTVSGGARGVDQTVHFVSLKQNRPTVFVLPSGLGQMYPETLQDFRREEFAATACFISEFESEQRIHKSHFYFRNRLIAALGHVTLVTQASLKSGSLLTVHHALENGKPVIVVPAHPEHLGFEGNLKLLRDGAYPIANEQDLLDFWNGEFHSK